MATFPQRIQSIGDALLNAAATATQLDRLGAAAAHAEARLAEYQAATQGQKAQIAVECVRAILLRVVKDYESVAAVDSAKTTAESAVETDFTQTP